MNPQTYPAAIASADLDPACLAMGGFYLLKAGKDPQGEQLYLFKPCVPEYCERAVALGHHAWRKDQTHNGKWGQVG